MDNIWGSMAQYNPVVWHWVIAVYLFLAGLSAGSILIGIGLRWTDKNIYDFDAEKPILKAAALIAPLVICLGLACLILDLTKPFHFWVILIKYNFTSVMALGVIALLIYTPLAFAYALIVFRNELGRFSLLSSIGESLVSFRKVIEVLLFGMAIIVGIYTGFLLSAMNSYPMLNTAVLPALFLFSALSAGAAANNLVSITFFSGKTEDEQSKAMHKLELPVISLEILFLTLIFVGLYFRGGAAIEAIASLVTGVWATVFWVGVVLVGFGIPLFSMILPDSMKHSRGLAVFVACCSLSGVIALRHFILYAGQSYIS
jgi:polysulfide reductase chain C